MRAVSLHRDVIVVTSQLFQAHCTLVRGPGGGADDEPAQSAWPDGEAGAAVAAAETFVIDSPVLPEELELLPALVEQAGFPSPQGLLVTHADWDHMLAPLAFPEAALGCAESTATRLQGSPGAVQRELRGFDEELQIERRPLSLGAIQPLAVPGRCALGVAELELHPTGGHTPDGVAIWIGWARVLVAGDYLSSIELPGLGEGEAMLDTYLATLELFGDLVARSEHVVPGHGPVLDRETALRVLDEDRAYLASLRAHGEAIELPAGRRGKAQRSLHAQNVLRLATMR